MHRQFRLTLFLVLFPSLLHAADSARRIADLNPGPAGSFPSNFTAYAGQLYFAAYSLNTGVELWKYNGSSVTLAADINDTFDVLEDGTREGNDSVPAWLTPFKGELYFSAYDARRGAELWRYDGTQAARVADVNPDASDAIKPLPNSSWPRELTILGDALYFAATSSSTPENYELWKFDSTGTRQVADLHPATAGTNHSSYPTGLAAFNGSVYFMADDGANGWELWRHTGSGTSLLNITPGGPESSSYPKYFTPFNSGLYFQAYHPDYGFEVWKTDGATATLAADLYPGAESSFPEYFTVFNGALYFRGSDPTHGSELRRYDGSQTTLAADVNPAGDSYPKNLTAFGNLLVFAANDGEHGWELWKFDGATASLISDLNPAGDSYPENFTINEGTLYFTAVTPDTGYELWKFDGTNITLAADVNPGPADSFPRFLTSYNGQLFFSAAGSGFDWEPWVLEPSGANQPPSVSLTSPQPGATFLSTENINITASASDDTAVSRVEFHAGQTMLATDDAAPYEISVTLPPGNHSLTAQAFDTAGAAATSAAVSISVGAPNQPPTVSLTAPVNGATFLSTETITIAANASDDAGIGSVEFYSDGTLLASNGTSPYIITTTLPPGTHLLTARATDTAGATATSAPITITVQQPIRQSPRITAVYRIPGTTTITVATTTSVLHILESSSDLRSWAEVANTTPASGTITFSHSTTAPYQFYRVVIR